MIFQKENASKISQIEGNKEENNLVLNGNLEDINLYRWSNISNKKKAMPYITYRSMVYNPLNDNFLLCLAALLSDELTETYDNFYSILKKEYHFVPRIITSDYLQSHINAVNNIFKNLFFLLDILQVQVFLHLLQFFLKGFFLHLKLFRMQVVY